MLYKLESKAAGSVILLGPNGDELMRILGREPAAKGIIEVDAMADAIARIEVAIAAAPAPSGNDDADEAGEKKRVALRQRLWPVVQMLRRCRAAREPIVWGV